MGSRTKTCRTRRTSRAYLRGLACARSELIFKEALATKQYGVALEAVKLQCRLHGFKIDGPGQPAPILSPEIWQQLHIDVAKRRVS